MEIRTYFWHARLRPRWYLRLQERVFRRQSRCFAVGNAGDIYATYLLSFLYGARINNVDHGGRRILTVGSIGHKVQAGDLLCGIGVKSPDIPAPPSWLAPIYGLRGPISYDIFEKSGYDVSSVRFLMDPGLLVRRVLPLSEAGNSAGAGEKILFIPHYRERWMHRNKLPRGVKMLDIDASPVDVAQAILDASLVYSSSLHGIIFAHALGRPCVPVKPQTEESSLKYEDYFLSVGLPYKATSDGIHEARRRTAPTSPSDLAIDLDSFVFPELKDLQEFGIAT